MLPWSRKMFPGTNLQDLNLDWILKKVAALRGGAAGQYLYKKSDKDFDFGWKTGGGGGGGTSDYLDLDNKPSINNVELVGNKTAAELGLGTYSKPGGGIPQTDLASDVQSALVPSGGDAGQIPVKASTTDYDLAWEYPQYSRPNLLDNWYFVNPVNQRGQATWQNANEYTVDRWTLTNGTASLGASGMTLNGTLTQTLETAIGQTVIASALLSDGSMISPTYNDSTKTFSITATGQTIKAVKLEIGSYQTLAHNEGTDESPNWVLNELPDYGQELAKCQRYQQLIGNVDLRPLFFGFCAGASRAQVQLDLPVSMAGTLTVDVLSTVTLNIRRGSTVGVITNVAVGNVRVYPDVTNTHLLLDFNNLSISNLSPNELLCCAMTSGSFVIYSRI